MRKVEEVLLYAGGIKNGCKHGWGEETVVERYSDQSEKFRIVRGRWQENVLMESCRELQKEERRRMGKEDI